MRYLLGYYCTLPVLCLLHAPLMASHSSSWRHALMHITGYLTFDERIVCLDVFLYSIIMVATETNFSTY